LGRVVHERPEAAAAVDRAARSDGHPGVRKAARLRIPGGSIYERTRLRTVATGDVVRSVTNLAI
jgi:hypothetical protein